VRAGGWLVAVPLAHPAVPAAMQKTTAAAVHSILAEPGNALITSWKTTGHEGDLCITTAPHCHFKVRSIAPNGAIQSTCCFTPALHLRRKRAAFFRTDTRSDLRRY
jgi:hypothetical protein